MATELTSSMNGYRDSKRVAYLHVALNDLTAPLHEALMASVLAPKAEAGSEDTTAELGAFDLLVADLLLVGLRLIGPGRLSDLAKCAAFLDLKKLVARQTAAPFDELVRWAVVESIRKPNLAHTPATLDLMVQVDATHQTRYRQSLANLLYWFGSAVVNQERRPTAAELQGLNRFRTLHVSTAHKRMGHRSAPRYLELAR